MHEKKRDQTRSQTRVSASRVHWHESLAGQEDVNQLARCRLLSFSRPSLRSASRRAGTRATSAASASDTAAAAMKARRGSSKPANETPRRYPGKALKVRTSVPARAADLYNNA